MSRHLYFVFLDGVGLGPADPDRNPFAALSLPGFRTFTAGQRWTDTLEPIRTARHVAHPIDATLGLEGLPQSGTGQASLFTGVNCAEIAGRHFGPFPHSQTKPVIDADNLFARIDRAGFPADTSCAFANAYPPRFFTFARRRDRWTVTTRSCLAADLTIRSVEHLHRGEALTADLTAEGWQQLDHAVAVIDEAEAARRFARLGRSYRLTLFEYYLTDKAGHSRDPDRAARVLQSLDRFFASLHPLLDPDRDLFLLTSDHGNLEDLSTKSHTRHPVPLIAYGTGAEHFADTRGLTDVVPSILRWFNDVEIG